VQVKILTNPRNKSEEKDLNLINHPKIQNTPKNKNTTT
jgi:hypothetical protein